MVVPNCRVLCNNVPLFQFQNKHTPSPNDCRKYYQVLSGFQSSQACLHVYVLWLAAMNLEELLVHARDCHSSLKTRNPCTDLKRDRRKA